jgi:hypothetical protein
MEKEQGNNSNARKIEIDRLMDVFEEEFKLRTSSADDFITIHEIERMWGELQQNTLNVFSDMIRDLMGKVDERDMIRKKNGNIPKEG